MIFTDVAQSNSCFVGINLPFAMFQRSVRNIGPKFVQDEIKSVQNKRLNFLQDM